MNLLDQICQVGILVTGAAAIWLISRREVWRRWGFIIGLAGQPFWIYTLVLHQQWWVLALNAWFSYSYCQGIWFFWLKKVKLPQGVYELEVAFTKDGVSIIDPDGVIVPGMLLGDPNCPPAFVLRTGAEKSDKPGIPRTADEIVAAAAKLDPPSRKPKFLRSPGTRTEEKDLT